MQDRWNDPYTDPPGYYTDSYGNDLREEATDDLVAIVPEAALPDEDGRPTPYWGLCRGCGQWYHITWVHASWDGGGCRRKELRG